MRVALKGITWDHPRGYAPLVAAALAWADLRPGVEIEWDRRSLWAFGEAPVDELVGTYDLLVIDHPFVGTAAGRGLLVRLDEDLPPAVLGELAEQSVGPSFGSYAWGGHQWALPVDASGQTSAARPDLLARLGTDPPATWDEVMDLAERTGAVCAPLKPIDALCCFFTLCALAGGPAGGDDGRWGVPRELAEDALGRLARLARAVPAECLGLDPVGVLDRMAARDDLAYAPLLFAYSNYARDGHAPHPIAFGDVPEGRRGGATLGGAGLAVSARSANREDAVAFAAWATAAECQRTVYVQGGGQPANRVAWEDAEANHLTHGFFREVLPTLDRAYLRPNVPGFAAFQAEAGPIVHAFLRGGGSPGRVVGELEGRYRAIVEDRAV